MVRDRVRRLRLALKGACEMTRRRTGANHRPLGQAPRRPKWTSQTRDALVAILEADTGLILHESMYEDGLGLERLLEGVGGKRSAAIEIIRNLVRKTTVEGAGPGSIHSWTYFVRLAKAEMLKVRAA
jgi:hypothetical protein